MSLLYETFRFYNLSMFGVIEHSVVDTMLQRTTSNIAGCSLESYSMLSITEDASSIGTETHCRIKEKRHGRL